MAKARWIGALLAAPVALAGCGNWASSGEHVGRVAAKLDVEGNLVIVVAPCRKGTPVITATRGRTPDESEGRPNEVIGEWTSTEATDEERVLNLKMPSIGWTGSPAAPPGKGELWIIDGTLEGQEGTVLSGPSVTGKELEGLSDDEVVADSGVQQREDFDGAC